MDREHVKWKTNLFLLLCRDGEPDISPYLLHFDTVRTIRRPSLLLSTIVSRVETGLGGPSEPPGLSRTGTVSPRSLQFRVATRVVLEDARVLCSPFTTVTGIFRVPNEPV